MSADNTPDPEWLTKMAEEQRAETLALLPDLPDEEASVIADAAAASVGTWGRSLDERTAAYYRAAFAAGETPGEEETR